MKRLVYAPRVEAIIRLENKNKLIDVTEDIISGSVSRRLNGMSTAQLQLQNKHGKYTSRNIIEPMDRIVIRASRMGEPFLVFSGFVDESPFDQLYPGPVSLAASDTIKLLQHTYFDPGLFAVQEFLQDLGWGYNTVTGQLMDNAGSGGVGNFDLKGGVGDVLREILVEIGGWPRSSIDIHNLPSKFISDITKVMSAAAQEASQQWDANFELLEKLYGITIETGTASGGSGGTIPQGNVALTDIARAAIDAGFRGEDLVKIVAVTVRESAGRSDAMSYNGQSIKSYGCGLWQIDSQHAPGGGGTGLAAPPGVDPDKFHTLRMPNDWKAVRGSLPANIVTYMENCFDPTFNAAEAKKIYDSQGIGAWFGYANVTAADTAAATKAIEDALKGNNTSFNAMPVLTGTTSNVARASTTTSAKFVFPLPKGTNYQKGGGAAAHNARALGNWQSDNAIDIMCPGGTPVLAVCDGTITRVSGQKGYGSGRTVFGYSATLSGGGNNYFYTHMDERLVNEGQVVKAGQRIGNVGYDVPGGDHLHFGIETGAPENVYEATTVDDLGAGYAGGGTPATGFTDERIAQIAKASIFSLQLQSSDPILANVLQGRRALANDVPLIEWVKTLTESSSRVFCTKPNGDFLSFHPDRFGYFNSRTPYFQIADVEVIDLNITKNDRELTTHVFTTGSMSNIMGQITIQDQIGSMYATIEDPAFKFFINADIDPVNFLKRYGPRPMQHSLPLVNHPMLLWMASWTKFSEQWSLQYSTNAQFTFMPELLPGGLVAIGDRIQMFIEEVTHNFDLGGGFTSIATLSSPAALSPKYGGLPKAGLVQLERGDSTILERG